MNLHQIENRVEVQTKSLTMGKYKTGPGSRYPFGATLDGRGVNFSIPSRHATSAELLLYDSVLSTAPSQIISLDPQDHRTYFTWHVHVEGLPAGTCYSWRVHGPNDTSRTGLRFDRDKALLDPFALAVTDVLWDRRRACMPGDNISASMRSIVVDKNDYDWEGDEPLNHSAEKSIIYEMHVGGFTRHPSSRVARPGTFAGLIEKIPYLKELGVTDVELLPVMAFDEQDVPEGALKRGLKNYWGYSPHSFFSPHAGYCTSPDEGNHVRDFRDMVKALHKAGIGVIMDVVFNHTTEGGESGPTISFKGLWNNAFYHLDPFDRRVYRDYTGCGNTVNCNHPLVSLFLLQCLEYWVREMHVDGFRFDLASVLARGEDGNPMYNAPVLWNIELSDALAHTKIIAEAWDAAGLYQVGAFPGLRWAEWNGRYRDVIRRFVRGDRGLIGELAARLSGSSDLYEHSGRLPINSINFVTCHDGFTLWDLVSYKEKHNESNGEENRDGSNDNLSWNCGAEGETKDPEVLLFRERQAKNFMAILLLSHGVPMILSGDEVLRTQQGNNNAYCQDNELSWFDWTLTETNKDMLRFVQQMIAFRKHHPCLMRRRFLTGMQVGNRGLADVSWYGHNLGEALWSDPNAQFLAYTLSAVDDDEEDLHVILNMSDNPVEVSLPELTDRRWYRAIDTARPFPDDIPERDHQEVMDASIHGAAEHSVVVLESR